MDMHQAQKAVNNGAFGPVIRLELTIDSNDQLPAVMKAAQFGWNSLTAREARICQCLVTRVAELIQQNNTDVS